MQINDLTWMIGGEAGFGIQSAGHIFALCGMRGGLHVFGNAEYPSLIRGGHNSDVIRFSEKEVHVHKETLDLLLAMNKETLDFHLNEIVEGGGFIYDAESVNEEIKAPKGVTAFNVPLKKIALETGKGDITRNTVGIGASLGLLDYDFSILEEVIRHMFGKKKGEEIVANNIAAAKAGYDFVKKNYGDSFGFRLKPLKERPKRMLITANDAVCMGAVKAGCKFVAEYPMTPSSSILHFMAANAKDYGIIVKHTEDEIAAMNMLVGAGFAGLRAMTGTSGGGFSLMVEALGMAGMLEVPLVCVEVQRPGPSTGLPTRTEQGDLKFALSASQGEFPRIVMAPGSFEEHFYLAFDAFNLSEKYQLPVIILSDKHMAESVKSTDPFDTAGMKVERGKLLTQKQLDELRKKSAEALKKLKDEKPSDRGFGGVSAEGNYLSVDDNFLRYKFEEDGVSPRTVPGMKGGIYRAATDEHDESGDLTETEENRKMMVEKRAKKMEGALRDLPAPVLYGEKDADITFVAWGSPVGAIKEAIKLLAAEGVKANLLQIIYMCPFHSKEVGEILRGCKKTIGVEQNGEGQLCALIAEKTGYFVDDKILKYSGRQFTAHEILNRTWSLETRSQ